MFFSTANTYYIDVSLQRKEISKENPAERKGKGPGYQHRLALLSTWESSSRLFKKQTVLLFVTLNVNLLIQLQEASPLITL